MTNETDQQRWAEKILDDESLISKLSDREAKVMIDWAMSELTPQLATGVPIENLDSKFQRIRSAMKEINELVGNRQSLVADDLEEHMVNLLVADLDPKSQRRLALEREIAQVTAEKDHLDSVELVRRLTQLVSKTWREKSTAAPAPSTPTTAGAAPQPASPPSASQTRPAPRPSAVEKKPSFWERLFGKK